MNDQHTRYIQRREACALPDGTVPYAWWKQYQRRMSYAKTMSDAEIQREAAYIAKAQADALGENE